jgi:hypothetical protein
MAIHSALLAVLLILFSPIAAQYSTFDPAILCTKGNSVTLSTCNNYFSQIDKCATITSNQELVDCMCTQSYFSMIIE